MALTFCIIDDEREVCDILRLYFEARGHRCLIAHDGERGLEIIRKHKPSAVFLDLQMPRMNGYEVLTELRRDPEISSTPVMMMTALTKEQDNVTDEQMARSANADVFLSKPFELDDLLAAVEKMTGVKI